MAILTSTDTAYIPLGIVATSTDLDNLLLRAQRMAESPRGANRSLELHSRTDVFDLQGEKETLHLAPYTLQLKEWPVNSVSAIEVNYWDSKDWTTLDSTYYEVLETGRLTIYTTAYRARATYQSGFDFAESTTTTETIKIGIGQLALIIEQVELGKSIDDAQSSFPPYLQVFKKYRSL